MISIFTLNLWRYYDFDSRLSNLEKIIKTKKPDVIFLQEVQIDTTISPFSQVEIIKNILPEYEYSIHSTIYPKESQRGQKLKKTIQHGMAIISRHPVVNSFEYYLTPNGSEPRSILCFDVRIGQKVYNFANIHFTNSEGSAKAELTEFLDFIHSRGERRIMAGDFNLHDLPRYLDALIGYKLSFDYKPYISYPKDNWCLDYIMIPDNLTFARLEMVEEYLSDHKGLIAEIDG